MTKHEEEIFNDLRAVIDKMVSIEKREGCQVFSYDALDHISYAMEHITGNMGLTDRIKETRQEQLVLLVKASN